MSFLGITSHWITDEWELKSFLLDFIKLEVLHSGINIKEAFLKSLRRFNIESKVSFFINNENTYEIIQIIQKNY
jgi:hypothetical protein